jgi:hypothetical protein
MNQEIEKATSNIAGVLVELIEPRPGLWIAAPINRELLHSKLWQSLRRSPSCGIGHSPLEAALLLCRSVGACSRGKIAPRHKAKIWLQNILANGVSKEVTNLKRAAQSEGITWSSVDRAARDLSISRIK